MTAGAVSNCGYRQTIPIIGRIERETVGLGAAHDLCPAGDTAGLRAAVRQRRRDGGRVFYYGI